MTLEQIYVTMLGLAQQDCPRTHQDVQTALCALRNRVADETNEHRQSIQDRCEHTAFARYGKFRDVFTSYGRFKDAHQGFIKDTIGSLVCDMVVQKQREHLNPPTSSFTKIERATLAEIVRSMLFNELPAPYYFHASTDPNFLDILGLIVKDRDIRIRGVIGTSGAIGVVTLSPTGRIQFSRYWHPKHSGTAYAFGDLGVCGSRSEQMEKAVREFRISMARWIADGGKL